MGGRAEEAYRIGGSWPPGEMRLAIIANRLTTDPGTRRGAAA
jgi:hypothetical protein